MLEIILAIKTRCLLSAGIWRILELTTVSRKSKSVDSGKPWSNMSQRRLIHSCSVPVFLVRWPLPPSSKPAVYHLHISLWLAELCFHPSISFPNCHSWLYFIGTLCDSTGITQIIQDNLLISNSLI